MAKKLGLALGAGAARGWAHIGVLQALNDIGLKPDVIAGCSVGALVGGAHLIGALGEFENWARTLKPLSALDSFSLRVKRGGFIDAAPAFEAFREFDQPIESLGVRYGAVATDLTTGDEVHITSGSVLDAARASSAIPLVFHAVEHENRWLVDGALSNPAPVSLARKLGADIVICVDLNAVPRVIERLGEHNDETALVPPANEAPKPANTNAVERLIDDTTTAIKRQIELAKSKIEGRPHLLETSYAAADIFQMHLARARMRAEPADLLLRPDMRDASSTAFDRADEFIAIGKHAMLQQSGKLDALLNY